MGVFVTLSSKGQLVIPAEFRQQLGLEAGHRLELSLVDGRLVLDRVPSLDEASALATAWAARAGVEPLLNPSGYARDHPDRRA